MQTNKREPAVNGAPIPLRGLAPRNGPQQGRLAHGHRGLQFAYPCAAAALFSNHLKIINASRFNVLGTPKVLIPEN
jgi:hypothetical protein